MKKTAQSIGVVAIVAALIGSAATVQAARERMYPPPVPADPSLYFASGSTLVNLTKGYNALAADLYWIRALQHYGSIKLRLTDEIPDGPIRDADRYPLLYPLLDITTTLDPAFKIAYRFGAIFLAEPHPAGAGRPDLAIALLEKGLRAQPDKWEYMQDAGFVHYWWRHDYATASEWFQRGADVPGAPWFLRSLAATTLAEGGDRNSSRTMWQSIRETAEIDWLRNEADRRLAQLDAFDAIAALQQRVDMVAAQTGSTPADWQTVIRAGAVRGIPLDPVQVPYVIEGGQVTVSRSSPLFPLPDEPRRLGAPAHD